LHASKNKEHMTIGEVLLLFAPEYFVFLFPV